MMKKFTYILVTLLFMVFTTINASVTVNGINYTLNAQDYTAQATGRTSTSTLLTIPDDISVEGVSYKVTGIAKNAFQNAKITQLQLGTNIKEIGPYAFGNCSSLTDFVLPKSLNTIGQNAFGSCTALTSIDIPDAVTHIGTYAFYNCKKITTAKVGSGVSTINYGVFYYCSALKNLTLPSTVRKIDDSAFAFCSSLTSFTAPASLDSIEILAFYDCTSLKTISIPTTVSYIGHNAFSGTPWFTLQQTGMVYINDIAIGINDSYSILTSVSIKEGITKISPECFSGKSKLTSITLPSTLKLIDRKVFNYCKALESLVIPASVEKINALAFQSCDALKTLTVESFTPPAMDETAINDIKSSCELKVPESAYSDYVSAPVWKEFSVINGKTVPTEPEKPDTCATPVISLINGKLEFTCDTEGAECHYTIVPNTTLTNASGVYTTGVELKAEPSYTVTCYATKEGYVQSAAVTNTITLGTTDVNHDGKVNVLDVNAVVNTICEK